MKKVEIRQPLFVVETPYDAAPKVVCYADTWSDKLVPAGRVGPQTKEVAISTLSQPSVIVAGTSNPNYIAFVNQQVISSTGSPYVVFVDPQGNPMPTLASLGYRQDFKDIKGQGHTVLWLPSEKD